MTKETKEEIKIWSAVVMLAAALGFGIAGFIVYPVGEIADSVLWLIAQLLLYAGTALGVDTYVRYAIRKYEKSGSGQ